MEVLHVSGHLKKKKKDSSFYLHKTMGVRAVRVDRTEQGQLLWVASSSLFTLKTSFGAPGIQLPQKSSGLHDAGFLLFVI